MNTNWGTSSWVKSSWLKYHDSTITDSLHGSSSRLDVFTELMHIIKALTTKYKHQNATKKLIQESVISKTK